jgi:transcriptional antiterminator
MADIQSMTLTQITGTTNYTNLNSISIINQSESDLTIANTSSSGSIVLLQGQTLTITSSTGFVLPTLTLDSDGIINASVITT